MADFTALAATSETLRTLLRDRMELPDLSSGAPVRVTVATPTQPEGAVEGAAEEPRINLFLYRVTENSELRNEHMVGQAGGGAYGVPPLSLDLHFLVTAYGNTMDDSHPSEIRAQQLLGSAMRVFHDHPVITEELVTRRDPVGRPVLDPSLRDSTETVKLLLAPVDLEDLSKVWTALTLRYRLSVGYVVSVVRIESKRRLLPPRLVGEPPAAGPRVQVATFRRPRVDSVLVSRGGDTESTAPYARVGDKLTVTGSNLTDGPAVVWLGDLAIEGEVSGQERLVVGVPDDPRLRVGTHPVRVEARVAGSSAPGVSSNTAVVTLVPGIMSATATVDAAERSLRVVGTRLYDERHEGETLVGDVVVPTGRYTTASSSRLTMVLPDELPDHRCRALVSGDLSAFPGFSQAPELRVTIGPEGSVRVVLARRPTGIDDAAELLEAALRRASTAPSFARARVGAVGDRLAIAPGGRRDHISVDTNSAARDLRLTADRGAATRQPYVSAGLRPFPDLSWVGRALSVRIAGVTHEVTLAEVPEDVRGAAAQLEAALRSAGPEQAFTGARAGALGNQLVVLGGADPVAFEGTVADPATVAVLGLRAPYPVRVRVAGLENVEPVSVVLP